MYFFRSVFVSILCTEIKNVIPGFRSSLFVLSFLHLHFHRKCKKVTIIIVRPGQNSQSTISLGAEVEHSRDLIAVAIYAFSIQTC